MLVNKKGFNIDNDQFLRHLFFEKRIIFLEGFISDAYVGDPTMPMGWANTPRGVIDQIIYLSSKSPEPIKLFIDSPGGFLTTAFSLLDFMTTVSCPIHTIGTGIIASAAVPVLAAGKSGKRFIFPHTRTMIHLPEGGTHGDAKDRKIAQQQIEEITNEYISTISHYTGKAKKEIESIIDRAYWMNAEETKAFGLVDHIVTNFSDIGINLN
ncbi:MAG: hypothetical protein A3G49_01180 [Candidatus Sungbacteria bacterium RIFCSPLOWO2_12_FULL_41_11]|uniref:ATP-dependent Clp protease proteolytic subunit n=1 Tax=Candidatus Sungbacteria bacterium RIFCSPLOWO2_12_FULL_41_11 TaxID=1802286 RepID=A0A1G2LM75_9BACT|nr:MAG: ATP-dependent Clp protease proteolytic subunit [Parcubacteria group bacterium GW2011_GWA2_42_14]OGZ98690.1 MAG: hypothetical protein A3D41_02950 [Candidatus Sungbacteria bacterium RIFCSPHIGHO2_02_FULL_41_12b]OHA12737.1 MAG: hypothetical protein A3G49_01180 [Candidatus Sungbacteria bacterium RIFCSPLOWO2_12_FULL_41_11]